MSLKFGLSQKKDGQSKKGLSRSASLLKKLQLPEVPRFHDLFRLTFSDRKNLDELKISVFPLDVAVRKQINLGSGKSVMLEMMLVRNDNRNKIQCLEFDDFLETARSFHEWQAENNEVSFGLLEVRTQI